MRELATFARWEAIVLLAGFLAIVTLKFAQSRGTFHQLLSGDRADGLTYLSAGRIQLLLVTTLFSLRYLTLFARHPNVVPDLPAGYLWALGGSQILYLTGKAAAIFFNRSIFQGKDT